MSKMPRERFEVLWEEFINKIRASVTVDFKGHKINHALMTIILNDAKSSWENRYLEAGVWFTDYIEENPEKGALIRKILIDDMRFTEVNMKNPLNSPLTAPIASIVCAAAGFGITSLFTNSTIIKTIVPTVAFAATTGGVMLAKKNLAPAFDKKLVEAYISQLEKYKLGIISILSDPV